MAKQVELELHFHHESDGAILVSENGDEKLAKWLPKSQIEWQLEPNDKKSVNVLVPEWLAIREGLI